MAKKVCFYGLLAALCIVLGYVEHIISLDFIAPGIKIGLANSVGVILVSKGKIKGAYAVNIVRILLSALLFSNPSSLVYSLSGGLVSLTAMIFLAKFSFLGIIGFSVLGAVFHNMTQIICAAFLLGHGVWYYLPFLLLAAAISGVLTGIIAKILFNNKILNQLL